MRGVPRERLAISRAPSADIGGAEHAGAARDDQLEFGDRIEIEPDRNAEAIAQRIGQQPDPRRRADERELRQIDPNRARRRTFADHQVELEILHRRIENFLDRRVQAMNFVDEEHIALFEIGQKRCEIAGLRDHRPRRRAEADAQFLRHDLRQRRLAETRADRQTARDRARRRGRAPPG